jgi:2-polyprenyl-6-methoxyphenol hydroxylase-like FAD-dependent oxidoreductase
MQEHTAITKTHSYDVVIVGAGLAGCAAATLFGREGLKVALIERRRAPDAYKVLCTHFIQASATPTLQRLGVVSAIEEAGGIRNAIDYWTRWGWIREPGIDDGYPSYGYNLRREKLDPMLRYLAASTPGVELLRGCSVRELLTDNQQRIIGLEILKANGDEVRLYAQLVVAADGRTSQTARLAGAPTQVKPNHRFGYLAQYTGVRLTSGRRSQMYFLEPDIAYTFPNDGGVTVLVAMPTRDKLPMWKSDPESNLLRMHGALPEGPDLRAAQRVSDIYAVLKHDNQLRPSVFRGMALIGDAVLSADPLAGVGCGWALQSAEWLVDNTAADLVTGGALSRPLTRYAKCHRDAVKGHEFLISDYSTGRRFKLLERLMFSAAARDEYMAHHLTRFAQRCISPPKFLSPRAIAKAAWVNLTYQHPQPTTA